MTFASALPLLLIEAFASGCHQGNGAAVVALEAPASPAWMQSVAASLRQSETAFVVPWAEGWAIRWFTPTCEVPLCGHATLAATLALHHWGSLESGETTVFQSRSGSLVVGMNAQASLEQAPLASMELPAAPLQPAAVPERLTALLEQHLGMGAEHYWTSALGYSVALLDGRAALDTVAGLAEQLPEPCRSGLVLMQPQNPQAAAVPMIEGQPPDYRLRFFAPSLGIPEDPVTGSAHALVAPYWCAVLGRASVRGWQCSPQGGGMVCEQLSPGRIRLRGPGRVLLEGQLAWEEQLCDPEAWSSLFPGSVQG